MGVAPYSDAALEREAAIIRGARLRALWLWCALAAGIAFGPLTLEARFVPSAAGFGVAAGLLIAALLTKRWTCRVLLTLAIAALGWAVFTQRAAERPATSLAPVIAARAATSPTGGTIITLRGTVMDTPRIVQPKISPLGEMGFAQPVTRFSVTVRAVADDPLTPRNGTLWVRIDDASIPMARAGDEIDITGVARPISPATNPGEFDLARWSVAHDVAGTLTLSNASLVNVVTSPLSPWLKAHHIVTRWHAGLRDRAHEALTRATATTPEPARSMVHSLVLGESPRDDTLSSAFLRLGLAHVLAISGFHLIVMSRLTLMLLRLTGDRGWLEPAIVTALVIGYMLIVPAGAPVLRSGIFAIALLAADAFGRRFDRGVLLILIAAALLLVDPTDLWSLGYQLSCGLTLLLVWCARPAIENLFGITLKGVAPRQTSIAEWLLGLAGKGAAGLVGSTLLCWLASAPLVVFRTGLVSPLSLIATVIIVPPATVLLWIAFISLGLGLALPKSEVVCGPVLAFSAHAIAWMVTTLDQLPLVSMRITRPDLLWSLAATVLAITWLVKGRLRHARYWAVLGLLVAWYAARWTSVHILPYRQTPVKIDMLDVGDGTCILLRAEQSAVLWDAGSLRPGLGGDTIARALTELNVPELDAIIISHPDVDHFGGVPELLRTFPVRRIYISPRAFEQKRLEPNGSAAALVKIVEQRSPGTKLRGVKAGDYIRCGPLRGEVLSPPSDVPEWTNDNDHSLIVCFHTAQSPVALLTADAGPAALTRLLTENQLQSTPMPRLLELPHHGSFNPQAEELVRQINPSLVLQSTGPRRLNNPAWDAARSTPQGPRPWLITARDGAVWVDFKRDGSWISGSMLGKEPR